MRLHRRKKIAGKVQAAAAAASSMKNHAGTAIPFLERNDDIFYEILKHLDAKALALVACVNRRWRLVAEDETLWEVVCTRDWPKNSSSSRAGQLRSVVIALGGFKRLYALCLRPLLSRPVIQIHRSEGSSAAAATTPAAAAAATAAAASRIESKQWSKDEVHLSLSLFSIDCYERLGRRYSCLESPLKSFQCSQVSPSLIHCSLRSPQA